MSVRKRSWITARGFRRSTWVCDFMDAEGVRRLKTFAIRDDAEQFATLHLKGPARIAVLPSHGSIHIDEEVKMNEVTTTTNEHPWEAARRHAKALSETLSVCSEGKWYAHVFPKGGADHVAFAARPRPEAEVELAIDRVNRLAWELAHALNDYQDGMFHARVYPSDQAGYAVMLTVTKAAERRAQL